MKFNSNPIPSGRPDRTQPRRSAADMKWLQISYKGKFTRFLPIRQVFVLQNFKTKNFFVLFPDICGDFCAKIRERKEIWFVFLLLRFCIFFPFHGEREDVPTHGAGVPSWKRGERLRPAFLFLLEEKKKRADLRAKSLASLGCAPKRACGRRPGTKKKRTWSGFRDESCSFFFCVYVLMAGSLVLCGLVFPLAPLPLTGTS